MSRTLVELSDRWDLQDLVTRYATCIDARDFEGLDRVFTPDARVSYEASGGPEADSSGGGPRRWTISSGDACPLIARAAEARERPSRGSVMEVPDRIG